MAENEENTDNETIEGEEEESGGGNKMLLMIAVPIILLLGAGAGLYFTGMLDGLLGGAKEEKTEDGEDTKDGEKEEKDEKVEIGKTAFLQIPPMIVNLSTGDGTPRYLRLNIQLELENDKDKAEVEKIIPKVVDQFQTYLRELRIKDLRGSAGIYRLQVELLWRVNQAASPIKVKDVLFQEILIQ